MRARQAVISLSRDSIWTWAIPADPGETWPESTYSHTVFKNTAGATLADIESDTADPFFIRYLAQTEDVNHIPAGARFETFVDLPEGPMMIRYGIVMRREAPFFDTPASTIAAPRLFEDSFQRSAIGARWEPVGTTTKTAKMYDNSAVSLPNGMGPNVEFFVFTVNSAVRYYRQVAGDSVRITTTFVKPTNIFDPNNGKTSIVLCADMGFTTGLALQVNTVDANIRLARVTSPTSLVYLQPGVADVFSDGGSYTVVYNHLTKTIDGYKGAASSPATSWVDTGNIIPHGNGYRHMGFIWQPALLDSGPQVSGWNAKDDF